MTKCKTPADMVAYIDMADCYCGLLAYNVRDEFFMDMCRALDDEAFSDDSDGIPPRINLCDDGSNEPAFDPRDCDTELRDAQLPVYTDARARLLSDIASTAMEGGSDYWCDVFNYHWMKPGGEEATSVDEATDIHGTSARLYDYQREPEDCENGGWYRLDNHVIQLGIRRLAEGGPLGSNDAVYKMAWRMLTLPDDQLDDIDFDAEVADVIVQAGLFGEVIYG